MELSQIQSLLLHWIEVYDWVFSLPEGERPTPYVIEDDYKFDAWLNAYTAKRHQEQRSSQSSSPKKGKSASQHKNVISM